MRVIVSHPEQQHSYRLAAALKEAGYLDKYITTVYKKGHNLTSFVAHILPKKYAARAMSRHSDELEDHEVVQFCEGLGLLKLFSGYFPPLKKYYQKLRCYTADRFAHKVAKYAIKHKVDAVVTYDNCSPVLFRELSDKAPQILRIMDMSAANLFYMKEIYEKDFVLAPNFAGRLKKERSYIWDDAYMDRIREEQKYTQYYLTPSEFVQRSLAYSGVKDEQMLMCPYGVDTTQFSMKDYNEGQHLPIKFIYVGGVKKLKGISFLLNAFESIPKEQAILTVVGAYDPADVKDYVDKVNFTGLVLHDEVIDLLKDSDVFVFPSLGDSFALSAIEAAACGLPLIVSENTGMKDQMRDGEEGFVIECQNSEQIKNKVLWFVEHPDEVQRMGRKAREMAQRTTWDEYDKRIKEICSVRHGGGTRSLRFVYVGGIKELKGVYYLLEAFKNISPNIGTLTIVGDYDDSEDIHDYLPYVTFTGRVPHTEIQNVLKAADVFIFPSLGEGMSLSVLEAAACGLPLIISDNSGFKEKIGEEGVIFDIQSVEAIQNKVNYLYDHQDMIPMMGMKARETAERYTWCEYKNKIRVLFKSIDQAGK